MNPDDKARFAPGETDERAPAPKTGIPESEAVRKDMTYSPSSERETEHKQQVALPDTIDDDIDPDHVQLVPGTGGPDDQGDVEVDPADLDLPWRD